MIKFLIVHGVSRSCIIGVDKLEKLKSSIDFNRREIILSGLEGNPSLKIISQDKDIMENIYKGSLTIDKKHTEIKITELLIQHLQYECSEKLKHDLINLKIRQGEDNKILNLKKDLNSKEI